MFQATVTVMQQFLSRRGITCQQWELRSKRFDLSGFAVTIHSGLCEQYVKSPDLAASEFDFLFARALVHCDNKPLQNKS